MGTETVVLIGLLTAALGWFITINIKEARELAKQYQKDRQDELERAQRIKKLTNKF